jgi:mRNA interferase MazF
MIIRQYDVYLVPLDPAVGSEMRKTRPCVVISPEVVNRNVGTVLIAPLTSTQKSWPSRVPCVFNGHAGAVALEQMRCVDYIRLAKHVGSMDVATAQRIAQTLVKMFLYNMPQK